MTGIALVWGCSVYQSDLVDGQAGASSASAGAKAESGSGGRVNALAGSAGTGVGGSSSGTGGSDAGGVGGVGDVSTVGGAGESSAGADTAGEGGALACVSETLPEFCQRVSKNCGLVDGADNCGSPVVRANCGACQGFKQCRGAGQDNVCGALTDPALGGIATASSVGSIGENGNSAFDLNTNTKWFGGDNNSTGWLAYQFAGTTSHVVHSYSITSANDVPQRDPVDWQLQGSSNGGSWIIVDQRSAQVFATRHQTNSFTCSGSTAYRWYRLLITANNGASSLQLAELALYGD
jgi:hypothetical protein